MSCMKCDLHKGQFDSENEFITFENTVGELVKSEQLILLGRKTDSRFFEIRYQCKNCNAVWKLSVPDQAFRGGWNEE